MKFIFISEDSIETLDFTLVSPDGDDGIRSAACSHNTARVNVQTWLSCDRQRNLRAKSCRLAFCRRCPWLLFEKMKRKTDFPTFFSIIFFLSFGFLFSKAFILSHFPFLLFDHPICLLTKKMWTRLWNRPESSP